MRIVPLLFCVGLGVFDPVISADAAVTNHVSPDGNGTDYGTWTGAATNIQGALDVSVAGDTVLVTNAVYALAGQIVVTQAVRLLSYGASGALDRDNTILQSSGNSRCVYLNHPGALIAGFTFTNGLAEDPAPSTTKHATTNDYGGGIYVAAGTLSNCMAIGNTAKARGGGVYAENAASLVTDCLIKGNNVPYYSTYNSYHGGGGAYLASDAVIENSIITDNEAQSMRGGGGLFLNGGMARNYCRIVANRVFDRASGGGVLMMGAGSRLIDCSVSNNVQRETLTGVSALYNAGGISVRETTGALIQNCAIVSNSAHHIAGGIAFFISANGQGGIITNCIVAKNETLTAGISAFPGGGGISEYYNPSTANWSKDVGIYNTIVESNIAVATGAGGAGIFLRAGVIIEGCIVRNNRGYLTGGVYIRSGSGSSIVRNTLITGNTNGPSSYSIARAAGLTISSNTIVENCTIVGNVVLDNNINAVGGLCYESDVGTVSNTIVMNNTHPGGQSNWVARTAVTPFFGYGCTMPTNNLIGSGNISADPVFGADHRLSVASPCVNAGANQAWMTNAEDLDGRRRIDVFGGRVDMGCYEHLLRGVLFNIR